MNGVGDDDVTFSKENCAVVSTDNVISLELEVGINVLVATDDVIIGAKDATTNEESWGIIFADDVIPPELIARIICVEDAAFDDVIIAPDDVITSKESWELIFTDGVICFEIDVGSNGVKDDVIISANDVPTKKEGGEVISTDDVISLKRDVRISCVEDAVFDNVIIGIGNGTTNEVSDRVIFSGDLAILDVLGAGDEPVKYKTKG